MKITAFETKIVDLTGEPEPIKNSPGESIGFFVTLKLQTDEGLEGVGYAGFLPAVTVQGAKAVLDALAELTIGRDPLNHEAIQQDLLTTGGAGSPGGLVTRAVSAIDVALWDIKGKAHNQPVWKLLGGLRQRVPCYASGALWRNHGVDELAASATQFVEQGFRAMKFRVGAEKTVAAEVERMSVLRETVGPNVDLMVDVNQGWDANRAIRVFRQFEPYDLYWLEDPIQFEDFSGMAKIADALDTPVCSGEYHYGLAPLANMMAAGAVDILMVDLLRVGGITGFMKAAATAEAFNVPVVSHLAPEVLAHAVAAAPNGLIVEHMPWSFPLFQSEPTLEDGEILLPNDPGLGLELR